MRATHETALPPRVAGAALALALAASLVLPGTARGQERVGSESARFPGSAVVVVDDNEFLVRLECRVEGRPEAGFITEANRITREETGRSNMVALRLRPWQDTDDVVVSLEGWVAWMPRPTSVAGVLEVELDMAATSSVRDGQPVLTTYEMWQSGDRPEGRSGVRFEADCAQRDPDAPAYRKLGGGG